MILSKEMEDGFLGYDISTRREVEHYRTEMYDDVFVHWEKKNMFGKIKRQSTEFSFKRLRLSDSKKDTFKMVLVKNLLIVCHLYLKRKIK